MYLNKYWDHVLTSIRCTCVMLAQKLHNMHTQKAMFYALLHGVFSFMCNSVSLPYYLLILSIDMMFRSLWLQYLPVSDHELVELEHPLLVGLSPHPELTLALAVDLYRSKINSLAVDLLHSRLATHNKGKALLTWTLHRLSIGTVEAWTVAWMSLEQFHLQFHLPRHRLGQRMLYEHRHKLPR